MTPQPPRRDPNPAASLALLASLFPFLASVSMLALKAGIGPRWLVYPFAQITGALMMGLIVVGSALAVVALARSRQRDLRIFGAIALLLLAIGLFAAFLR